MDESCSVYSFVLALVRIVFMRFIYVVEYNSWVHFVAVYYSIVCTGLSSDLPILLLMDMWVVSSLILKAILLRTFWLMYFLIQELLSHRVSKSLMLFKYASFPKWLHQNYTLICGI